MHGGRATRDQFAAALSQENGLAATGERRYLTDPPTEVREPLPSAMTEYEDIEKKKKKRGFFARLFGAL